MSVFRKVTPPGEVRRNDPHSYFREENPVTSALYSFHHIVQNAIPDLSPLPAQIPAQILSDPIWNTAA